ncbi:UNVERIFIED_CONTAM: hypothetical protein Slati_3363700 [Sesamum latifolium]|uniref:Uncharacterized protein n=1 Tax=Sesamum latifolium TaxID=2727402 RepID=A0AAW2UDW7_9LAMI
MTREGGESTEDIVRSSGRPNGEWSGPVKGSGRGEIAKLDSEPSKHGSELDLISGGPL